MEVDQEKKNGHEKGNRGSEWGREGSTRSFTHICST